MRTRFSWLVLAALAACSGGAHPDGGGGDAAADTGPASCSATQACPAGQVCDRISAMCVACVTTSDCPAGRACMHQQCVATTACTSSRMCPGQVCDPALGYCVDCVTDTDCTGGQVCQRSECVAPPPACRSSRECSALGLVCDTTRGVCVECVAAADCGPTEFCASDGLCTARICTPGAGECVDPMTARRCDDRGAAWTTTRCAATQTCSAGACMSHVCAPGETSCDATGARVVCNPDGLGTSPMPCPAMQSCRTGLCVPWACTPGSMDCASPTSRRVCTADGLIASTEPCPAGQGCRAGACVPWSCTPGAAECVGTTMRRVCSADGSGYVTAPCAARQTCAAASCQDWVCTPGTVTCSDAATASVCSDDGLSRTLRACAAGQSCAPPGGCTGWICTPGSATCTATGERSVCNADGLGRTTAPCAVPPHATAATCVSGACVPTCDVGYVASGTGCRAAADVCPGRDVVPDGAALIIPSDGLSIGPDYGTTCGSGGRVASWVDWVAHFTLSTSRDVLITMTGGTASTRMQLQSTCSAGGTPVGPCLSGAAITQRYRALPPGDYFIVGENDGPGFGPISVQVTTTAPGTRLPGDACPGVDVMVDGATVRLDPTPFDTTSDVGTACGSRGPTTGWIDWVFHFSLATARDVTINLMGLPVAGVLAQLQQTCAPGGTIIGACNSEFGSPTLRYRSLAAGDYYLVLESSAAAALGPMGISVTTAPPTPVVNYSVTLSPPGASFVDICSAPGAVRILANMDDNNFPVASSVIPFPVRFYGLTPAPNLTISSNGWLSLQPPMGSPGLSGTVPAMTEPNLTMALFWADLFTRSGGVCYGVTGTAPNRQFVVQWQDAHFCCSDDPSVHLTFEAIINEQTTSSGNNIVDLVYQQLDGAAGRTPGAGIENEDGTLGTMVPTPLTAPRVVRFTPSM